METKPPNKCLQTSFQSNKANPLHLSKDMMKEYQALLSMILQGRQLWDLKQDWSHSLYPD